MEQINLSEEQATIVREILSDYPYDFYVFGSRAQSSNHEFSDLDLCFTAEINKQTLVEIRERFYQSKLPFKVDLVAFVDLPESFQAQVRRDMTLLSKA